MFQSIVCFLVILLIETLFIIKRNLMYFKMSREIVLPISIPAASSDHICLWCRMEYLRKRYQRPDCDLYSKNNRTLLTLINVMCTVRLTRVPCFYPLLRCTVHSTHDWSFPLFDAVDGSLSFLITLHWLLVTQTGSNSRTGSIC